MSLALNEYLDRVMVYANRSPEEAAEIRAELEDHLLKKVSELEAGGMPREDAVYQAVKDYGSPRIIGYGLRPRFPLIDVRTCGTARGVFAFGPKAVGIFAFGGIACGVFAFGGLATGLFTMGGFALSLILAFGGFAIAPVGIAYGGFAAGALALGGCALGIYSSAGLGIGIWGAPAGAAMSLYPAEQSPSFLNTVSNWLTQYQWAIQATFFAIFIPGLLVNLLFQRKEYARIRDADPDFVE